MRDSESPKEPSDEFFTTQLSIISWIVFGSVSMICPMIPPITGESILVMDGFTNEASCMKLQFLMLAINGNVLVLLTNKYPTRPPKYGCSVCDAWPMLTFFAVHPSRVILPLVYAQNAPR